MTKTKRDRVPDPTTYTTTRYLAAKTTVDDRALNRHVIETLRAELSRLPTSPHVLEIGAGLGTMVARLVDWDLLKNAEYTLLDVDGQTLDAARSWLAAWASSGGRALDQTHDALRIRGGDPSVDLTVRLLCAELRSYLEQNPATPRADLLIANAFLDLVELPSTLFELFNLLAPGGLYWFSINFDGETIFQPDHALDGGLFEIYHRTMDERVLHGRPAGDRYTGRHLFGQLRGVGASILAAGSSDWVVHAQDGRYAADEAYFIEHILHTIEEELDGRPEVDPSHLRDWLATRRQQLDRGELVYIAHQLDFVGRTPLLGTPKPPTRA